MRMFRVTRRPTATKELATMADSKLATFLSTNKLNTKRLLAVSHKLETLQVAMQGTREQAGRVVRRTLGGALVSLTARRLVVERAPARGVRRGSGALTTGKCGDIGAPGGQRNRPGSLGRRRPGT